VPHVSQDDARRGDRRAPRGTPRECDGGMDQRISISFVFVAMVVGAVSLAVSGCEDTGQEVQEEGAELGLSDEEQDGKPDEGVQVTPQEQPTREPEEDLEVGDPGEWQ
jgi:hypothetical protein